LSEKQQRKLLMVRLDFFAVGMIFSFPFKFD